MEKIVFDTVEKFLPEFEEVSTFIFEHPELGEKEYVSSKYLTDKIREHGFEVQYPYCDIETAFRAELKCGAGPKVAFLAEYDALPGYGENHDKNGHACGHNWIAALTYGACVSLSKLKDLFKGTIVFMGTPAEETVGAKCDMVDRGAFDDIDAVFQMHLGGINNLDPVALAMDSIEFSFEGVAAHAAAYPHLGVNALDAVQLTYAGINALRQHITPDARIHGIITNGGQAANIVPHKAQCRITIRAEKREYLNTLTQKVINCARGAELMTGAKLSYRNFENSFDDLVNNENLRNLVKKNLIKTGITEFTKPNGSFGSSDIGNVSHVCPTFYCEIDATGGKEAFVHEEGFLQVANSEEAHDKLNKSIKALVLSAIEVSQNPDILK